MIFQIKCNIFWKINSYFKKLEWSPDANSPGPWSKMYRTQLASLRKICTQLFLESSFGLYMWNGLYGLYQKRGFFQRILISLKYTSYSGTSTPIHTYQYELMSLGPQNSFLHNMEILKCLENYHNFKRHYLLCLSSTLELISWVYLKCHIDLDHRILGLAFKSKLFYGLGTGSDFTSDTLKNYTLTGLRIFRIKSVSIFSSQLFF